MNFKIPGTIKGFELRLRQASDAKPFFAVIENNRAYLRKWLPWLDDNTTHLDTLAYIKRCQDQFSSESGLDLGIWFENQWVGSVGFHDWDKANKQSSIGYWLAEEFTGRSIMTASVNALVRYGFTQMKLNRIEVRCAVRNRKSRAIAKRLGMKHEGTLRQAEFLYDHFVDLAVYSLLKIEWTDSR